MEEIIKLLDGADELIRKKIAVHSYGSLGTRNALKEAREALQKAITILLDAK